MLELFDNQIEGTPHKLSPDKATDFQFTVSEYDAGRLLPAFLAITSREWVDNHFHTGFLEDEYFERVLHLKPHNFLPFTGPEFIKMIEGYWITIRFATRGEAHNEDGYYKVGCVHVYDEEATTKTKLPHFNFQTRSTKKRPDDAESQMLRTIWAER